MSSLRVDQRQHIPPSKATGSALRALREATFGTTRGTASAVARMLRITPGELHKIEHGQRGINPRIQDRILARYGPDAESILRRPNLGNLPWTEAQPATVEDVENQLREIDASGTAPEVWRMGGFLLLNTARPAVKLGDSSPLPPPVPALA